MWHNSKSTKRRPSTYTGGPGKENVYQRSNREVNGNCGGAGKIHSSGGRIWPGQMSPKLNFLALVQNAMSGNPTLNIVLSTPSCCGDAFHQQVLGNWSGFRARRREPKTEQISKKTCFSLQETSRDSGRDSPSSRTMTLSIQPELHCYGLRQRMPTSSNGPVKAQTSIQLRICCKTFFCCSQTVSIQSD